MNETWMSNMKLQANNTVQNYVFCKQSLVTVCCISVHFDQILLSMINYIVNEHIGSGFFVCHNLYIVA